MDTPRSNRRKSNVCYKEDDSFVGEFDYSNRSKPKRSISKKSYKNSSDDISKDEEKNEIGSLISSDLSDEESLSTKMNNTKNIAISLKHAMSARIVLQDINQFKSTKLVTESPIESPGLRRGMRMRHKSSFAKKAEESCKMFNKLAINYSQSCSDSDDADQEHIEKPTTLFTDDDVEGKQLFSFKMLHRKQDMARKALEAALDSPKLSSSCRTPKTPRSLQKKGTPSGRGRKSLLGTPKNVQFKSNCDKTPLQLRNKMKKKLEIMTHTDDSEDSDFSASGSDFCPSDNSSSSDDNGLKNSSDESVENQSSDSETEIKLLEQKHTKNNSSKPSYSLRNVRGERDAKYIMKSDDYFSMQGNKKVVTSNHTLERLRTPRLTADNLLTILKNQKLSHEHQTAIKELLEDHQKLFDKWLYVLSEGFSVLLHGVGTKQKLIQEFQMQKLSQHPCIVINGFFPSLTVKDILESIITDLLQLDSIPSNTYEAVDVIDKEMSTFPDKHLFLLIHNIDGAMLRNHKTQHILSRISKIKNIHMVASIDYINAPLFWDHTKLSNFNFLWWDVTTLLPYTQETSFESSLLVHKSGALALSSLRNVFQSLTTNARGIFMIIVNNQLKNKKTPHFQGISFKDLYAMSRDAFLVSSDHALRAQLTEFLDHKLLKTKRTADGVENLNIPIDNVLLEQFIENEAEEAK